MSQRITSLTKSQTLLWIGQELNPESPMYNMGMRYEIQGSISVDAFKKAFSLLVAQSDSLRSVFIKYNGIAMQHYLSQIDYEVEFIDFSKTNTPLEYYKRWESERITRLFDLEKCLFDCALIKLDNEKYVWYINQHHLITDGWSTSIVFSKMSQLYNSVLQGVNDVSESIPLFEDYSLYCGELMQSDTLDNATKYWEQKLKDLPQAAPLYFKKDTHSATTSERCQILLGKKRSIKLKELANQKGIRGWTLDSTYYTIFLTVLFAYLHRITGQDELVIGSPSHNRTSKAFKNTVGLFIESFPLKISMDKNDTFLSLFEKVQIESNSFLKNAQTGTSNSELSRSYNTYFNYINATNTAFSNLPVKTDWVHPNHIDPRHHIRLHVHDFDNTGTIKLYFDLNTQIFNKEERSLVPQHFLSVLDFCTDHPEESLSSASIITATELQKIKGWNDTNVSYPIDENLLSQFNAQVLKTPEQIALVFNDSKLTYQELDRISNKVAHFLINKGIGSNDIVTVSMERSLEMIIYIYGILKAGGAYLPVDPSIPSERLLFIVNDAQSKILLHNYNGIDPAILNMTRCLHTDHITKEISSFNSYLPEISTSPEDLAYVIYTSGSTGKPKGVLCHHKGICNRLNWMNDDHPLSSRDVLIQKTPITFDVSLWELFWPLQRGATLVIENPEGHKDPEALLNTIKKNKVNIIHFVPSMLSIFLQTEGIKECTSLKKIFCSGEALPASLVNKTYDILDIQLYNLYGPTEASVEVTSWLCDSNKKDQNIPIGHPVSNTKLYILDECMNQTPIGIPGELYIGGVQLAHGYLNRNTLTETHFIKNPFSNNSDDKLYKTGDLTRYRSDGAIEYLGRIDHQIKLKGIRIELGEIEKNIEEFSGVSQAVVIVNSNNLIAYYTGKDVEINGLKSFLEQQLPAHMIPYKFNKLERFEYLSSGKVDRKSLNSLFSLDEVQQESTHRKPETEIEQIIHDTWREILKIENIGIQENYIRLGGDSLNAISITSRLKQLFDLDLNLMEVFNYPTIKSYANHVEKTIINILNSNQEN